MWGNRVFFSSSDSSGFFWGQWEYSTIKGIIDYFSSIENCECIILNTLFFFFHVRISWFSVNGKFPNFLCQVILFITCHIHRDYTIPNSISKYPYGFKFCKFIRIFESFLKHFSWAKFLLLFFDALYFMHNFRI